MFEKPSWLTRFFLGRFFGSIDFERRCIDIIKDAHKRGPVVYLLENKSLLDYLYFNIAFLQHVLPLARFANGVRTRLFRPFLKMLRAVFQRPFPSKMDMFERTVGANESTLLFLRRPTTEEHLKGRYSIKFLDKLAALAKSKKAGEISLVPLLLVWEKRSDSYHATLFDEVFGARHSPGRIRKFFHFIQNFWQSLIRAGRPTVQVSSALSMSAFLRDNDSLKPNETSELLLDQLLHVFEQERRVIVGPPFKPAAMVRAETLKNKHVDQVIQKITRSKLEYPRVVKKRARKQLKEIAANFSLGWIKFLSAAMNPIFDALYEGYDVDADGLDVVRKTARDRHIVLVPSHKSHMDYLLISNVFYQHGLMPPHIAAGANLSFFPLGFIFRKTGAFFLRRSFQGDELYTTVFSEYLIKILNEGFPVEFFIEGTRSRTGKLGRPRYGMASMVLRAVAEGRAENITFIPINVGYEKIVEGRSYSTELMGGEKQSENLSGVLKATKVLRTKHGRVYVEFEQPLDAEDFVKQQNITKPLDADSFDLFTRRLAYELMCRINDAATITPSAVVATALLHRVVQPVKEEELLTMVGFIVTELNKRGARLSNSIANHLGKHPDLRCLAEQNAQLRMAPSRRDWLATRSQTDSDEKTYSHHDVGVALLPVILEAIQLFADSDDLKIKPDEDKTVYTVPAKHRFDLNYYRNLLVHFFAPDGVLVLALSGMPAEKFPRDELKKRALSLSRLLKYEFCFGPSSDASHVFDETLQTFLDCGWINEHEERGFLSRPEETCEELLLIRGIMASCLESYWVVAACLDRVCEQSMSQKDYIKACFRTGRLFYVNNQLRHFEALSKPTFQNAIDLFRNQRILEIADRGASRRGRDRHIRVTQDALENGHHRALLNEIEDYLERPSQEEVSESEDSPPEGENELAETDAANQEKEDPPVAEQQGGETSDSAS